jgi:hypothetical protein
MATITDGTTVITPELVLGYETTQASRNIVHEVLGRPDPDVTLAPAGTRSGTLSLFFLTEADAEAARVLHTAASTFTLTDADRPAMGMVYVTAGAITVTLDDQTRERWTVAVEYREVLP